MFKEGKVLLATDFSETAEKLIECLEDFKKIGIDEILLTHIVDVRKSGGSAVSFKKNNEKKLSKVKKTVEALDFKASIRVEIGHPDNEIISIAEEENCDLILMASHGGGIIKQIFLGSTTYNVMRKTTIPIFIEKYKNIESENFEIACRHKLDSVLLPIDFSDCTEDVLGMIKKMNYRSEEIILASIIESSDNLEELNEQKVTAEAKLEEISEELSKNNVSNEISIEVRNGAASQNIIEIAEEKDAGLIIMSTRGSGFMEGILVGSTADEVARRSPVPVLLVPCKNK